MKAISREKIISICTIFYFFTYSTNPAYPAITSSSSWDCVLDKSFREQPELKHTAFVLSTNHIAGDDGRSVLRYIITFAGEEGSVKEIEVESDNTEPFSNSLYSFSFSIYDAKLSDIKPIKHFYDFSPEVSRIPIKKERDGVLYKISYYIPVIKEDEGYAFVYFCSTFDVIR